MSSGRSTYVFILIGGEGCGKTYMAKQLAKPVHPNSLFVFDVNNEWQKEYPYPFDRNIDKFLNKFEKVKNGLGVFEDATSFFPTRGEDSQLKEMMTARRHTGNSFILLFHSFQDVPKYILRKGTDIVIFKTKDLPGYMNNEYRNTLYLEVWQEVQNHAATNPFYNSSPPKKGTIPSFKHFRQ